MIPMALTNPKDFDLFCDLIPKPSRVNVWFFPIRSNRKNPECPAGTTLKANLAYRMTQNEARNRLVWGSNVGIYALQGGLMFLDLDVSEGKLLASQTFLDALEAKNTTLRIKTRNGGYQYYFLNEGKYPNQVLKENGIQIGELRTDWFYVVSVGSHVEPDTNSLGEADGTYRISKESPITQFQGFGDFFQENGEIKHEPIKTFSKKTETQDISHEEHIKQMETKNMKKRTITQKELKYMGLYYGKSR
jgi:hypothetical protein